jgi:hypothetical protein
VILCSFVGRLNNERKIVADCLHRSTESLNYDVVFLCLRELSCEHLISEGRKCVKSRPAAMLASVEEC